MKGGSDVGEKPLPMWVRGGEDKYVENCCSNNFARENDTTKFTGKLGPGQGNLLRKKHYQHPLTLSENFAGFFNSSCGRGSNV